MKSQDYLKVLDKKKNNDEANVINLKGIEDEIKKFLRKEEQERHIEISTNELKNKIIQYVSEHIENWNVKDYVNREGMIETNRLIGDIFDDIINYGIIQKLVEDPEVTEINSNGRYIFYEIKGKRRPAYNEKGARLKFNSPEEQEVVITTLIGNNDVTFDNRNRLINVKTFEGYRLSATYKTARTQVNKEGEDDYSDFTLRKFKEIPYTLQQLCRLRTLTDNMARIMKLTVNNTTHVFCGVVGSGKTASHRAELEHIRNNKRVGVVQYPSEINLCKYNKNGNLINDVFQWEAVDSQKKSRAVNTQVNLMAHELRNSPEISVTNEIRYAEEFWNFLLQIKEGAKASTTFHASNSKEAVERMTNEICGHTHQEYKVVLKQVVSSLELIYIQEKLEDGTRKIMQISEVIGCEGDEPILNDIYVFVPDGKNKIDKETGEILEIGGSHKMIGTFSDKFKRKLKLKGVTAEEIKQIEGYKVKDEEAETMERYTGEGI